MSQWGSESPEQGTCVWERASLVFWEMREANLLIWPLGDSYSETDRSWEGMPVAAGVPRGFLGRCALGSAGQPQDLSTLLSPLPLGHVFSTSALGWGSKLAYHKHPRPHSLAQAGTHSRNMHLTPEEYHRRIPP